MKISIKENASENAVCKMVAILSQPLCCSSFAVSTVFADGLAPFGAMITKYKSHTCTGLWKVYPKVLFSLRF